MTTLANPAWQAIPPGSYALELYAPASGGFQVVGYSLWRHSTSRHGPRYCGPSWAPAPGADPDLYRAARDDERDNPGPTLRHLATYPEMREAARGTYQAVTGRCAGCDRPLPHQTGTTTPWKI